MMQLGPGGAVVVFSGAVAKGVAPEARREVTSIGV